MPMPAEFWPIGPGIHPITQCTVTFGIDADVLLQLETDVEWKWIDARLLPEAIKAKTPTVAFGNLKRPGFSSEAWCYSTKPPDPPQEGVFLVYICEGPVGFSGPLVFDWDWRAESKDESGFPLDWNRDFGEPLWIR